MAKPICVVYFNPNIELGNGKILSIQELQGPLQERMPDYYVFCIPSHMSDDGSAKEIEFKVFHEKDFTEIQHEELKQLILDSIHKTK